MQRLLAKVLLSKTIPFYSEYINRENSNKEDFNLWSLLSYNILYHI